MTVNGRKIVLWSCDYYGEELPHETRDAAIEGWLHDNQGPVPSTLLVYGYARKVVPMPTRLNAKTLIEYYLESHWEEFLGEDQPKFSGLVVDAAFNFLIALYDEFEPWACEAIYTERIDVAAWIAQSARESGGN